MRPLAFLVAVATAAVVPAQWTTFHGNNQRNGLTSAIVPNTLRVKWSYDLKGQSLSSPIVAPNGDVFIGPVWEDVRQPKHYFYALRSDGTLKWRLEVPWVDDQSIGAPALDGNGRVYFGTPTGKFYCVNPDGTVAWTYQGQAKIETQVLVTADGVYAGIDQKMVKFGFDGTKLWESPWLTYNVGGAAETLQGNIVFYRLGKLVCVNPSGTELWSVDTYVNLSSPVVSPNGDVIACGQHIQWFDPVTGDLKGANYPFMDTAYGSPSVDRDGNVYHATGYRIYRWDPIGNLLAQEYLQDPNSNYLGHVWSSGVVDGSGRFLFGKGYGYRSAIGYEKGIEARSASLARVGMFGLPHITGMSNIAVAQDGTMVVGSYDGKVYAIGQ